MREAQLKKIPYILVIGDKEMEKEKVNLRVYGQEGSREIHIKELIQEVKKSHDVLETY
ncbi:threonine-tRNA ligase [Jeotgalibacillus campisalis]|uniref:Threonine-tRNA ligase n=1 Tax=Jeotgalibacillus campisalis TaxID=220754 RepID=A0A0C2RKX6_9BACL|nr:threonine-tRNA ligase [Jeotgalibacillus campisalis]